MISGYRCSSVTAENRFSKQVTDEAEQPIVMQRRSWSARGSPQSSVEILRVHDVKGHARLLRRQHSKKADPARGSRPRRGLNHGKTR